MVSWPQSGRAIPQQWRTYGEAAIAGNVLTVGEVGDTEGGTQPNGFHGASIALAPADSYTFTFDLSLATWDSYNDSYSGGSGTGFWDAFSISVTSLPYDTLELTNDPLQFPLVWGGTQWGDGVLARFSDNQLTLTFPGDGENTKYLNLVLDTGNPPAADQLYPSWGTFSLPTMANLTLEGVAEENEETIGGYIFHNDNDTDENETLDYLEDLAPGGDEDLVPLYINSVGIDGLDGSYYLNFSAGLKIWFEDEKGIGQYGSSEKICNTATEEDAAD